LRDDYDRIAQRALAEKKERVVEKWFQEKLPTYYIKVEKEYQDCESLRKQFPNYAVN
jgi:peptidyl-prolyl cis-trans isomerase SurA